MVTLAPGAVLPFRIAPLNNIAGATYRDGVSHAQILEKLRVYVNDVLRVEYNEGLEWLVEELNKGIANAEAVVIEAKEGWETLFDAYMLDVTASLQALNDHAMSELVNDPGSETGAALVNGFVPRIPATTIYVDNINGSDSNNGELATPLRTISEAIRIAEQGAQNADTAYVIQLAAGTYTERVTASAFTPYALNVTIQGPEITHPGTPVVLFTEGVNAAAAAMKFENPNATFTVKYIKFRGYNGSSSSAGINSAQGRLFTVNVHTELCFYGLSSTRGQIDVKGGIFDNNGRLNDGTGTGAAIRSLMLNRHSVGTQSAGNLGKGPVFRNNRYGFFAQENSTGHVDWCTFTDNESGVVLRVNARGNVDGSAFERNLTDIAADGNAHVFISDNVVFGTGINKSGDPVRLTSGAQSTTTRAITGENNAYSRTESVAAGNYTAQTITGTTDPATVLSYVLRAPWWNDVRRISGTPVKRVRIKAVGSLTGGAGTVQVTMRLGGKTSPLTFGASETGSFTWEGEIIFPEPGRQIVTSRANRNLADTPRVNVSEGTVDMSADQTLLLQATLANGADAVTFSYVELIHA